MRTARFLAILLMILMTTSTLTPSLFLVTEAKIVVDKDETWIDQVVLNDNLTIINGAELTLDAGTHLEISGDHWIEVSGVLKIEGTQENPVTINSSVTPLQYTNSTGHIMSHGSAGLWEGINVVGGGSVIISNATIENARSAFEISSTATGTFTNVTFNTNYRGIGNSGTVSVHDTTCNDISYDCIYNTNDLTVDGLDVAISTTAISQSSTIATVTNVNVADSGVAFRFDDGSGGDFSNLDFSNVSSGFQFSGTNSGTTIQTISADDIRLLADVGLSSGYSVSDITATNVGIALLSNDLVDFTMSNAVISGDGGEVIAIQADNEGTLNLNQIDLTGFSNGVSLTGSGTHNLNDVNISATNRALIASGSGTLNADGGTWTTLSAGVKLTSVTSSINDVTVQTSTSGPLGIEYFSGTHTLSNVVVDHTYSGSDQTSVGVHTLWSTLTTDNVIVSGFNTGVKCDIGSSISGTHLTTKDSYGGIGVNSNCNSIDLSQLTTKDTPIGLKAESGTFTANAWNAHSHTDAALYLFSGTENYIRTFEIDSVTGWTAKSDDSGEFFYGSNTVTSSQFLGAIGHEYTETEILVVDLAENPLENVNVDVHTFSGITSITGTVTLPLTTAGLPVTASNDDIGITAELSSSDTTPLIHLPILPETGNWVIQTGINVVLTDFTGSVPENITIQDGASLKLVNSTLSMTGSEVTLIIEGSGKIIGDLGTIVGGTISIDTSEPLEGVGDGLHISSPVTYTYSGTTSWTNVHLSGDLNVGVNCELTLGMGSASGNIVVGQFSTVKTVSVITVYVIDRGVPVSGAQISVVNSGTTLTTDNSGKATFASTGMTAAYNFESSGTDIGYEGTKMVYLSIPSSGISDQKVWDTNSSEMTINFVASTLQSGDLNNWIILDSEWSPYYLPNDATILGSGTLQMADGSNLKVADGKSITVEGTFTIGKATIQGFDWNGIIVEDKSTATFSLNGGHILNARMAISVNGQGSVSISGAELANSIDGLMSINDESGNSPSVSISNSILRNGGAYCISVNDNLGTSTVNLLLDDVLLTDCGDEGVRAIGALVDITNVTLTQSQSTVMVNGQEETQYGAGNNRGIYALGASGSINGLYAETHSGDGAVLHIIEQTSEFVISNIHANNGISKSAIVIEDSSNFELKSSNFTGNAIHLIKSTGIISDVNLVGGTADVAIKIERTKSKEGVEIKNSQTSGYGVGLELTGINGNSPIVSNSNNWGATNSISSSGLGFVSTGDIFLGDVSLNSTYDLVSVIYDSEQSPTNLNATGSSSIEMWATYQLSATIADINQSVDFIITVPEFGTKETSSYTGSGMSADIQLLWKYADSSGTQHANLATLTARESGALPYSGQIGLGDNSPKTITVALLENTAPLTVIQQPLDQSEHEEGYELRLQGGGADIHTPVTLVWELYDIQVGTTTQYNGADVNVSDLEVGSYTLTLTSTDVHGMSSSLSHTFTVVLRDSDNDWQNNCSVITGWVDSVNGNYCGPDVEDLDDDNDGIKDEQDDFQFDECASKDTDGDGSPDTLVEGCLTELVEDDDDDGNGILDSQEGLNTSSESESFVTPGNIFLLLVLILIGILVVRRITESSLSGSNSDPSVVEDNTSLKTEEDSMDSMLE